MENKNRRREREEQYSKSVTEDLVTDIISRLRAKDLTRFTSVSKSWRSSISTDTYFRRLHSERTASIHRPFLLIERVVPMTPRNLFFNYWIDLDSIEGHSNHIREINNPFDHNDRRCRDAVVIGSCNGLVLLRQEPSLKTAVSNPTTKEHVMIPPNPAGDANVAFCGLGYDRIHDCYKVVAKVDHCLELMVYDLNKGAWRSVQFGPWWRPRYDELKAAEYERRGTWHDDVTVNSLWNYYSVQCVNGAVYWCIHDDASEEMAMMVCFFLVEEEFQVVKPPGLGEVKYYPNNNILDDRVALMCSSIKFDEREVWSLDMDYDDGMRQWRWTKLFAISDPYAGLPSPYPRSLIFDLIPLCFSECRNKVLLQVDDMESGPLFWYDLRKKEFRRLDSRLNKLMDEDRDEDGGLCKNAKSCVSGMAGFGFLFRPSQQTSNK